MAAKRKQNVNKEGEDDSLGFDRNYPISFS